jgi:hypothetical protein
LTDEPFTRNDLITIQDPSNLKKFNLAEFHHVKNKLKIENEGRKADSYSNLIKCAYFIQVDIDLIFDFYLLADDRTASSSV